MLFEALVIALLGMIFVVLVAATLYLKKLVDEAGSIRVWTNVTSEHAESLYKLLLKTNSLLIRIDDNVNDVAESVIDDCFEELSVDEDDGVACEPAGQVVEIPPIRIVTKEEFMFGRPSEYDRFYLRYDPWKNVLRVEINVPRENVDVSDYEYQDIAAICGDCLKAFEWRTGTDKASNTLFIRNDIFKADFEIVRLTKEELDGKGNQDN